MKEHLERLIQIVKETKLVERLRAANSLAERVQICEEARATTEFVEFKGHYYEAFNGLTPEEEAVLSDADFACTADNAVEIAIILIIEGIDDTSMFEDDVALISALEEVKGKKRGLANSIANFFYETMITCWKLEQILTIIF